MSSSEKYRMFRQYMTNELSISREDIEMWVREVAEQEIKKIFGSNPSLMENCILRLLRQGSCGYPEWREIESDIVRKLSNRIAITVRNCPLPEPAESQED